MGELLHVLLVVGVVVVLVRIIFPKLGIQG